ncbi:MAG: hypothetical protein EZS28_050782 [Streblomastix strix]|uniref:Uncharacterized protein n=1 Tax=Streblomastix strix TaxID=222440 RepID=A0A5J4T7K3_9EUKA|nr:MAG: hypothetical protein EZS28_050782 [Streblomastix strix]
MYSINIFPRQQKLHYLLPPLPLPLAFPLPTLGAGERELNNPPLGANPPFIVLDATPTTFFQTAVVPASEAASYLGPTAFLIIVPLPVPVFVDASFLGFIYTFVPIPAQILTPDGIHAFYSLPQFVLIPLPLVVALLQKANFNSILFNLVVIN